MIGGTLLYPLGMAVLLVMASTAAHRRLPPPVAARFVSTALALIVLAALPTLGVIGLAYVGHLPFLGSGFQWCARAFGIHGAVPAWMGVPAVLLLTGGLIRACRLLREHRRLRIDRPGPVEVSTDPRPFAATLPGRGGRIVLSRGLVELLDAQETEVVLAHERAHAHFRHDRYLLLAELAAALVPPLRSLADRVRYSLERWADEAAVQACGDRRLVADTVGKVALSGSISTLAAGFSGLGVLDRVEALLALPSPLPRRCMTGALWASLVVSALFSAYQLHHLERLIAALCPH